MLHPFRRAQPGFGIAADPSCTVLVDDRARKSGATLDKEWGPTILLTNPACLELKNHPGLPHRRLESMDLERFTLELRTRDSLRERTPPWPPLWGRFFGKARRQSPSSHPFQRSG